MTRSPQELAQDVQGALPQNTDYDWIARGWASLADLVALAEAGERAQEALLVAMVAWIEREGDEYVRIPADYWHAIRAAPEGS